MRFLFRLTSWTFILIFYLKVLWTLAYLSSSCPVHLLFIPTTRNCPHVSRGVKLLECLQRRVSIQSAYMHKGVQSVNVICWSANTLWSCHVLWIYKHSPCSFFFRTVTLCTKNPGRDFPNESAHWTTKTASRWRWGEEFPTPKSLMGSFLTLFPLNYLRCYAATRN